MAKGDEEAPAIPPIDAKQLACRIPGPLIPCTRTVSVRDVLNCAQEGSQGAVSAFDPPLATSWIYLPPIRSLPEHQSGGRRIDLPCPPASDEPLRNGVTAGSLVRMLVKNRQPPALT